RFTGAGQRQSDGHSDKAVIDEQSPDEGRDAAGQLTRFALAGGLGTAQPVIAPSRTPADELPEILCGRYQLAGLLGAGGMGVVYRAKDLIHEQLGEPDPYVALKLLGDDFA